MSELQQYNRFKERIFSIESDQAFNDLSLEIFYWQYANNSIYQQFCRLVHRTPDVVCHAEDIPFLPIRLFKEQKIITEYGVEPVHFFQSSGTSGMDRSRHYLTDIDLYLKSFVRGFELFHGSPDNYVILALLPGYLEQPNSSLVYMMRKLIELSGKETGGFFLDDIEGLYNVLKFTAGRAEKTILLGVTYALIDFASHYQLTHPALTVIETGGMKGRKEELLREDVHRQLSSAFDLKTIGSEYGMTELMSQSWSQGEGIFVPPPWKRVVAVDVNDPLSILSPGKSGALGVIDLANLGSCCFVGTLDIGRVFSDGSFEVLGRLDHSDIRGCSLLLL